MWRNLIRSDFNKKTRSVNRVKDEAPMSRWQKWLISPFNHWQRNLYFLPSCPSAALRNKQFIAFASSMTAFSSFFLCFWRRACIYNRWTKYKLNYLNRVNFEFIEKISILKAKKWLINVASRAVLGDRKLEKMPKPWTTNDARSYRKALFIWQVVLLV